MNRRRPIILLITSCIIVSVYYKSCDCSDIYVRQFHGPILKMIKPYRGTEDYLINTTGCLIPNYIKTFKMYEYPNQHKSCGQRAVFVKRTKDQLTFKIDENVLNRVYNKRNYSYRCCYSIVTRSTKAGFEDKNINYSQCKYFKTNYRVLHESEVYTVTCTTKPSKGIKKAVIYNDAYLILKKQKTQGRSGNKWNLLLVGIDSNSRGRLIKSMPKTAAYLQRHGWLDFRGFQKIGYHTVPNFGALLTGQNLSTIYKTCVGSMDACNHLMIWERFRKAGYKTAYSEDNVSLPDTFYHLNGFKVVPTNHYTRPFYIDRERSTGNLICAEKLPSSEHMLNYAYDFVDMYKLDSFFGVFWINSISHNLNYLPTLHDENVMKFFEKINSTRALRNTFIAFVGDHGMFYGTSKVPIEAYYEERLPMLYIWIPIRFRQQYPLEYHNLKVNQNRLVTHYDLHLTFQNILDLTNQNNTFNTRVACKSCMSIFQEIPESRVCADVEVNEKWCTCRTLVPIERNDTGASASLELAASYIQDVALKVKTKPCTKCKQLQLDAILRTHVSKERDRNIYVVAFTMKPININYEATVVEKDGKYKIADKVYTISKLRSEKCVKTVYDTAYCMCEKDKCPKARGRAPKAGKQSIKKFEKIKSNRKKKKIKTKKKARSVQATQQKI